MAVSREHLYVHYSRAARTYAIDPVTGDRSREDVAALRGRAMTNPYAYSGKPYAHDETLYCYDPATAKVQDLDLGGRVRVVLSRDGDLAYCDLEGGRLVVYSLRLGRVVVPPMSCRVWYEGQCSSAGWYYGTSLPKLRPQYPPHLPQ